MNLPHLSEASNFAPDVDHLLYYMAGVSVFFIVLIFALIFYFAIRYRRRSKYDLPEPVHAGLALEIAWSVIPFGLTLVQKCLLTGVREGAMERSSTGHAAHAKYVGQLPLSANICVSFIPVHLRFSTPIVGLRNERLVPDEL